jgi:hypothetical protein
MVLGIHFSFTVDLRFNILLFVEHLVGFHLKVWRKKLRCPEKIWKETTSWWIVNVRHCTNIAIWM